MPGSSPQRPLYTHETNSTPERVGQAAAAGTVTRFSNGLNAPPSGTTENDYRQSPYANALTP
jgi:hypothetical protein